MSISGPQQDLAAAGGRSDCRVFVSYRRGDSDDFTDSLVDDLREHFGHVFKDLDTVEPGVDLQEALHAEISTCQAVVAVIGRTWATDELGRNRISEPEDWVRMELEVAF